MNLPMPPILSPDYFALLLREALTADPSATQAFCDRLLPAQRAPSHRGGRGLAILFDAGDAFTASDLPSLRHAIKLAMGHGLPAEIIAPSQIAALADFDALWIRSHTAPGNSAYAFARQAERLGLPVLDDSSSIRRCSNKVFQALRFAARRVPTPATRILSRESDLAEVASALGLPLVLKMPDGSFSTAVHKVDDAASLKARAEAMFRRSHFIVAQEFTPTSFDWRIALLDGQPLFACKYRMARGHWQILKHEDGRAPREGGFSAVPLDRLPGDVAEVARAAAEAMGDGLYGVDLKETPEGIAVIEVNDNPNLIHGTEDRAEGDAPWLRILSWFSERMAARMELDSAAR